MQMSETLDKIKQFERDSLRNLLNQCTPKQQKFFERMYAGGVDLIPREKILRAIVQCEATIKKNNAREQNHADMKR